MVSRRMHGTQECLSQIARGCIAIFAILCCSFLYDRVHCQRNSGVGSMKQWHRLLQVLHENAERLVAAERDGAAEHLKKDDAQLVDVCPVVNLATAYHFGRHIVRSAEDGACICECHQGCFAVALHDAGDAEVGEEKPAIRMKEEVARL